MNEIRHVQLSEIAELITKGTTPTTLGYQFQDEGVNFLKIEYFDENGNFIEDKATHISIECHEKLKRSQLKAGDILFSIAGAIGRVAIVTEDMLPANTNQALAIIRISDDDIYLPYIKLILTSPIIEKQFGKKKQGVAQLNLSLKDINELSIPLPDMDSQVEYADLFSKVRAIIDQRNLELKSLDDLVKARFVELFGDLNVNPKGWELKPFDELTNLITDGEHSTPRRCKEGIYLLSARNVLNHELQLEDVDYIDDEEYERISKRIIPQSGDVLLSCSGTVGRCCCVPEGLKFQMVRSIALLRFKEELNPVFAEYMITSDFVQQQIDKAKTASSQANLFQGKIAKLRGFVPPRELQDEFLVFVKQVDKSKAAVQKSLDETQLLFDSLMQKFFG